MNSLGWTLDPSLDLELLLTHVLSQNWNTNFQSFMLKNNLVAIFILTPQLLLSFHLFDSIKYFLQNEDHPFLLYQACIDPFSFYDVNITKVLPWDNFLIFVYDLVIVLGNLYLWKYLSGKTETNHALGEVDRKKERKRNFVTAKNGVITSAATVFTYIFCGIFSCEDAAQQVLMSVCLSVCPWTKLKI